jgi:hypothetical protein
MGVATSREFQAIQSLYFDPDANQYSDEIHLHRTVFEEIVRSELFDNSQSMIVSVESNETNISRICSLGAPHQNSTEQVYVPAWILENLGFDQGSFENTVTLRPFLDNLPNATKIYIKPLDTAIYHTDIRECFEEALQTFHVLQEGTLLKTQVSALGNYEVSAYVDRLEPASIVRLGGEVHVEFLEPELGIPEFIKEETDIKEEIVPITNTTETTVDSSTIRDTVRSSWLKRFETMKNQPKVNNSE